MADDDDKRVDLVFEGGGVKGIGLAGAFRTLADRGWRPQRVAGTSAGAITAALVAAGHTGAELERTVLEQMDFTRFADGRGGLAGRVWEVARHSGLHSGDYFLQWMREQLAAKGVSTFGDLRGAAPQDAGQRLQVIASDLSQRRLLVLPRDAALLGLDPDRLGVAEAVRMSMSIPVFFDPWIQRNPRTGHEHTIVDGGLLSNYPVWLFDVPGGEEPRWPTFGMLLVAPSQRQPLLPGPEPEDAEDERLSLIGYVGAIAHTATEAHDRLYVERAEYARTIPIPTLGVGTTQFDIGRHGDLARRLFDSGREAAARFLATWDFAAYKAAFRGGTPAPSRRQRLVADLESAPPG